MLRVSLFTKYLSLILATILIFELSCSALPDNAETNQTELFARSPDLSAQQQAALAMHYRRIQFAQLGFGFQSFKGFSNPHEIADVKAKAAEAFSREVNIATQAEQFKEALGGDCDPLGENASTTTHTLTPGISWLTYQRMWDCDEGFGLFSFSFPQGARNNEATPQVAGIGLEVPLDGLDWEQAKNRPLPLVLLGDNQLFKQKLELAQLKDEERQQLERIGSLASFLKNQNEVGPGYIVRNFMCTIAKTMSVAALVLIILTTALFFLSDIDSIPQIKELYCNPSFHFLLHWGTVASFALAMVLWGQCWADPGFGKPFNIVKVMLSLFVGWVVGDGVRRASDSLWRQRCFSVR